MTGMQTDTKTQALMVYRKTTAIKRVPQQVLIGLTLEYVQEEVMQPFINRLWETEVHKHFLLWKVKTINSVFTQVVPTWGSWRTCLTFREWKWPMVMMKMTTQSSEKSSRTKLVAPGKRDACFSTKHASALLQRKGCPICWNMAYQAI